MDPILAQSSDYFTNSSLTNKTAELSNLLALPEPFPTLLALLYGGTASIAFITNVSAVIILVKNMKISADTDVMYGYWRFPLLMCPLSRFMSICTICVSIFTLIAIGIERYLKFILLFLRNLNLKLFFKL
jgi:hypothetical protein